MKNAIATIEGKAGEYTGFSHKTQTHNFSMYDGSVIKKTILEGIKFYGVEPVKNGDNITIIGRRWFDKINGNTYFSAVGLINGVQVVNIDFDYGYGSQYEFEIYKLLELSGLSSRR